MRTRPLILAGTTEATELARCVAGAGIDGIVSFAGRVARPLRQPLPQRVGGFGGIGPLTRYVRDEGITHLIDATHPFAARISRNAARAAADAQIAHCVLTRPAWQEVEGDRWARVPDVAGAVAALNRPRARIMLAIGRMHLADFAVVPQHWYLLRLVDPPEGDLPLPETEVIIDRGPFDEAADRALMLRHGIEVVVSKNSGGSGAYAKISAARALHLPVIMIDRPHPTTARTFQDPRDVMHWIAQTSAHLGV